MLGDDDRHELTKKCACCGIFLEGKPGITCRGCGPIRQLPNGEYLMGDILDFLARRADAVEEGEDPFAELEINF